MTTEKPSYATIDAYVETAIEMFLHDPPDKGPDGTFQRGFLAALVDMYVEALGHSRDDPLIVRAEAIQRDY